MTTIEIEGNLAVKLPDFGEDGTFVRLLLPTGELVDIMYKSHYGTIDVCAYRRKTSSEHSPGFAPVYFVPLICEAINLADTNTNDDYNDLSGLHPAERAPQRGEHIRLASQIILSVGPTRERDD